MDFSIVSDVDKIVDAQRLLKDAQKRAATTFRLTVMLRFEISNEAMVLLSDLRPLFASNAGVDNFGARPTGPIRMSADTALNSALGYGEQFTALGMYSSGSQYGRLGTSFPLHPSGTKVSLSVSYMDYQVVTP
jgi:hypothetical protein